ncbi:magnesium-protoporphyrin IX monomethyl ester anaerobic oxidative cyclase [Deltaproteobacteria bacterium OttesenSCG-928-K17]|nr:magnesium-protoporphyrin IX monomethyl ester anaerobic oxidative cyclase [Deltaproteobacteria bacterium OttesenSCG-928-K17]
MGMNILLINPPHLSIGSRLPKEHLPPLGLLSVGGPLIDAGHAVELYDADYHNYPIPHIAGEVLRKNPDVVMLGHSGSTSAQPIINEITKLIREKNPGIKIIIGGVFPTFHWHEVLANNPQIDYIVCGEGEQTTLNLINALDNDTNPETVKGLAFRVNGVPSKTPPADLIYNLDEFRVGWELMKGYDYTYWGKHKAVVIQFSRGCQHSCIYCGQNRFWKKWRHRSPQALADEFEILHREYGVVVFDFADENPAADRETWKELLEAIIAKQIDIILVGSIRADHIVRDADILHLYKRAGFDRFLLGIENYNEDVLKNLKKGSTISKDRQAIQLLRKHDIISMATYVVGFGDEKTRDFYNSLRHLLSYDPDQIQLMYATPHKWTPYFEKVKDREVILTDQRKWDFKHQVLAMIHLRPWQTIIYVKLIEAILQSRPKTLMRLFFHRDKRFRKAMWWYTNIGKRVWVWELFEFFFLSRLAKGKMLLRDFWA